MDKQQAIKEIKTRVKAAREFLVVVLGLALANAITEGVHHIETPRKGSANLLPCTAGCAPGPQQGLLEPVFAGFMLFAFTFYVVRFFLNNWIYFSRPEEELYEELHALKEEPLSRARMDLVLSITSGVLILMIGAEITSDNVTTIMLMISFHYAVDMLVVYVSSILPVYRLSRRLRENRGKAEQLTGRDRKAKRYVEAERDALSSLIPISLTNYYRAGMWQKNNKLCILAFVLLMVSRPILIGYWKMQVSAEIIAVCISVALLLNSGVAVLIGLFGDRETNRIGLVLRKAWSQFIAATGRIRRQMQGTVPAKPYSSLHD